MKFTKQFPCISEPHRNKTTYFHMGVTPSLTLAGLPPRLKSQRLRSLITCSIEPKIVPMSDTNWPGPHVDPRFSFSVILLVESRYGSTESSQKGIH